MASLHTSAAIFARETDVASKRSYSLYIAVLEAPPPRASAGWKRLVLDWITTCISQAFDSHLWAFHAFIVQGAQFLPCFLPGPWFVLPPSIVLFSIAKSFDSALLHRFFDLHIQALHSSDPQECLDFTRPLFVLFVYILLRSSCLFALFSFKLLRRLILPFLCPRGRWFDFSLKSLILSHFFSLVIDCGGACSYPPCLKTYLHVIQSTLWLGWVWINWASVHRRIYANAWPGLLFWNDDGLWMESRGT